jgi:ribosomal protein S18 acetylase RimI-like enzyme
MCMDSHCGPVDQYLTEIADISKEEFVKLLELYCEIWKEPPWNENFWTPEMVRDDLMSQMAKTGAVGYVVMDDYIVSDPKIIGFSWGYQVIKEEMRTISGGEKLDFLFLENKIIFYVDELGVSAKYRQEGCGRRLTSELLIKAKNKGASVALLRTEKEANAARRLYKNSGFQELPVSDLNYPGRTYWSLAL